MNDFYRVMADFLVEAGILLSELKARCFTEFTAYTMFYAATKRWNTYEANRILKHLVELGILSIRETGDGDRAYCLNL